MAARVRALDWSATPAGAVERWPLEVKTAALLVLDAAFPAALAWGDPQTVIHNDGFAPLLGGGGDALGRSFAIAWPEGWAEVGPIGRAAAAGEAGSIHDCPLVVDRAGQPELARFTVSCSPVRSSEGDRLGFIVAAVEAATSDAHESNEEVRRDRLHDPAGHDAASMPPDRRLDEGDHPSDDRTRLAELQNRVRNILTVVRSVFTRTVEAGGSVEDIADHFRGRLDALARTQVVVTRSASGLVDLENMIRDELLSVGASDGPSLTINGPEIVLPPDIAESMALAIHELTTNSIKFGALKTSGGQIEICWSHNMDRRDGRRVDLTWIEQGVPAIALAPSRKGFGSELIEDALPYRLRADTKLEFRGGGVRCTISVPLPD